MPEKTVRTAEPGLDASRRGVQGAAPSGTLTALVDSSPRMAAQRRRIAAFLPVQRTLDDAKAEAPKHGVEPDDLRDRATLISRLALFDPPGVGAGVDAIRSRFNANNLAQRVVYADIWPDPIPQEVTDAQAWAQQFVSQHPPAGLAGPPAFAPVRQALATSTDMRAAAGLQMLGKFIFYATYGHDILTHLLARYSDVYKNALSAALGAALSTATVADEVFKDIPEGVDPALMKDMSVDTFIEPFNQGRDRLLAALGAGYPLPVVIEHFFMHDKGYLNASAELTADLVQYYTQRLQEAQQAQAQQPAAQQDDDDE